MATPFHNNQAFIDSVAPAAMEAQRRYGIPASIIIAEACDKTNFGRKPLYTVANNLFGVTENSKAYRQYNTPQDSIKDFARIVGTSKTYSDARKCAPDDYRGWAKAMDAVSTDFRHDDKLIGIIEKYDLYKYGGKSQEKSFLEAINPGNIFEAVSDSLREVRDEARSLLSR